MSRNQIIPVPEFGTEVEIPFSYQELNDLRSENPERFNFLLKEIRSVAAQQVLKQYSGGPRMSVVGNPRGVPASPFGLSAQQRQEIIEAEKEAARALRYPTRGFYAGDPDGIPKDLLISAAIDVPRKNIDINSGLPASVRAWASLSTVEEERDKYLELVTGGKIRKINIDGHPVPLLQNADGTFNLVDEEGFSPADLAELAGFAPAGVAAGAEFGFAATGFGLPVVALSGPLIEGFGSEALNAYFRAHALNPAIEKSGEERIKLLESGVFKRGAVTALLGLGGNMLSTIPGTTLARQARDILTPDETTKAYAKAFKSLEKEISKKIDEGLEVKRFQRSDVPLGPRSMEMLQEEDVGRMYLQEALDALKSFNKNIYDPKFLTNNPEIFEETLDKVARVQIMQGQSLRNSIKNIDQRALKILDDSLRDRLDKIQNLKLSKGEYNYTKGDLETATNPFSNSMIGLRDAIVGKSDNNYADVLRWANTNKKSIKTKDFFERMERVLKKHELDELAELYAKEIRDKEGIAGRGAYKALKQSRGFDQMIMNFKSLNDFYHVKGSVIPQIERLRRPAFQKALNKERFDLLGDKAGKDLLKSADNYYSDYVDPLRKILAQATDKYKGSDGLDKIKGYKNLTGINNLLKNENGQAEETFKEVMRLFDDIPDRELGSVLKQEFVKSLRSGYMIANNAFGETPSGAIVNPSYLDKKLQNLIFGKKFDDMFDVLKDINDMGGKVGSVDQGLAFLDNIARVSDAESNVVYKKLLDISEAKVIEEKRLASMIFNNPRQLNAIKQKGMMAKYIVREDVSDESIENFLSIFDVVGASELEKNTFKALVKEELFANNQKSGYLFDGEKVLKILNSNDKKYRALFGQEELSQIKSYADVVSKLPKPDSKFSKKAMETGSDRVAVTADPTGKKVRAYYRWLSGLNDPRKRSKILATHLQSLGKGANSSLRRAVLESNPDYLLDDILLQKIMGQVMATDQGLSIFFGEGDPIAAVLANEMAIYLNTMNKEKEIPKVQKKYPDIKK